MRIVQSGSTVSDSIHTHPPARSVMRIMHNMVMVGGCADRCSSGSSPLVILEDSRGFRFKPERGRKACRRLERVSGCLCVARGWVPIDSDSEEIGVEYFRQLWAMEHFPLHPTVPSENKGERLVECGLDPT